MKIPPIMRRPTVQFGHYLFEADGTPAPIEWNVLDERETPNGKQKLLWSKYVLDVMPFSSIDLSNYPDESMEDLISCASNRWEYCSLREWLNRKFFNLAFTKEERERILPIDTLPETSRVKEPDHVFLLSVEEFRSYFSECKIRPQLGLTPYARKLTPSGRSWLRSANARGEVVCELNFNDREALFNPEFPICQISGWKPYETLGVHPAIWVQFDNETENEKGEK